MKTIILFLLCYASFITNSQVLTNSSPVMYPNDSSWYAIDNDVAIAADEVLVEAWADELNIIYVALRSGLTNPPQIINISLQTGVYNSFVDVSITEDASYVVLFSHDLMGSTLTRTVIPLINNNGTYTLSVPTSSTVATDIRSYSGVETDEDNRIYSVYINSNSDLIIDVLPDYASLNPALSLNWRSVNVGGPVNLDFTRYTISTLQSDPTSRLIRFMGIDNVNAFVVPIRLDEISPNNFSSTVQWSAFTTIPQPTPCLYLPGTPNSYKRYYSLDISAPYIYDDVNGIINDQYLAAITFHNCGVHLYSPYSPGPPQFAQFYANSSAPSVKADELELQYSDYCTVNGPGPQYYLSTSRSFNPGGMAATFSLDITTATLLNPYLFIQDPGHQKRIFASIANDEGYILLAGIYDTVPGVKDTKCLSNSTWFVSQDDDLTGQNSDHSLIEPALDSQLQQSLEINDVSRGFTLYPNPSAEKVRLLSNTEKISHVTIYDMSGKMVRTYEYDQGFTQIIDVKDFPSGMYIMTVNNVETLKIVKR